MPGSDDPYTDRVCEIDGCDRDAETDVATRDVDGAAAVLVVCGVCEKAYKIGQRYTKLELREGGGFQ